MLLDKPSILHRSGAFSAALSIGGFTCLRAALPLIEQAARYFIDPEDPVNAGAALERHANCLAYATRHEEAMGGYEPSELCILSRSRAIITGVR